MKTAHRSHTAFLVRRFQGCRRCVRAGVWTVSFGMAVGYFRGGMSDGTVTSQASNAWVSLLFGDGRSFRRDLHSLRLQGKTGAITFIALMSCVRSRSLPATRGPARSTTSGEAAFRQRLEMLEAIARIEALNGRKINWTSRSRRAGAIIYVIFRTCARSSHIIRHGKSHAA